MATDRTGADERVDFQRLAAQRPIRQALDAVSSAVVMIDGEGMIVLVNVSAAEMFDYDVDALLGQPVELLLPARFRRRHRVLRTSYARTNQARQMGVGRALFGRRAGGEEFPVEIGLTPIRTEGGTLVMSTIVDLTELRRRELETLARNEELTRLNLALEQFAYSASHALKAPLSSMSGLLRFASEDLATGDLDEVRENLGRAERLASELAHRIETLLAYASADDLEAAVSVELPHLFESTWREISGRPAKRQPPELTLDLEVQELVVVRRRLLEIAKQLLDNALKFADPNVDPNEVWVRSRDQDTHVEIVVSDNGIGIPEEHHERVFERFRRFATTPTEGAGLGLALVKKHVEALHGTIRVESSDRATSFVITLPKPRTRTP